MMRKFFTTVAATALVAAPAVAAPPNPAASLSVAKSVRAGSIPAKKSELAGSGALVAVLAAAAVVGGIILIADKGDSN